MKWIERHQGREAIAPVSNALQQLGIRGLVGIEHLYIRANRTRIGQRQTSLKADARGRLIQRGDLQCVVQLADDDAWTRVIQRAVWR